MQTINLRELYPSIYKADIYMEVSDEIYAVFIEDRRAEAARKRRMYRYKAQYSLDYGNGIEKAIINCPPTPEEIIEKREQQAELCAAVMALPGKQARRIYAHFYLDMTITDIAKAEGVVPSRSSHCIKSGLRRLAKLFKQT